MKTEEKQEMVSSYGNSSVGWWPEFPEEGNSRSSDRSLEQRRHVGFESPSGQVPITWGSGFHMSQVVCLRLVRVSMCSWGNDMSVDMVVARLPRIYPMAHLSNPGMVVTAELGIGSSLSDET